MMAFIKPPKNIPIIIRFIIWMEEKKLKKQLLPARILSWYPKAVIGSGIMEGLIADQEGKVTKRLLKLIRMQVSFIASCPFCIDMNSFKYDGLNINIEEIEALQSIKNIDDVKTFSTNEKIALKYVRSITSTPISIDSDILKNMLSIYNEREFVVIVSTIAQVNFWARLIQGLGIPPEGFSNDCKILNMENYLTLKKSDD
jgi:alkylhydroperoxidase family enzyme